MLGRGKRITGGASNPSDLARSFQIRQTTKANVPFFLFWWLGSVRCKDLPQN